MTRTLLLAALTGFSAVAYAQETELVHQRTLNGTVLMTGNTLGRSGYVSDPNLINPTSAQIADKPGRFHSAFTWINDRVPATQDNANWGNYTTSDWRKNFSYAKLEFPGAGGGRMVKAWLLWAGSCVQHDGITTENVSANLSTPVTFEYATAAGSGQIFVAPTFTEDHCGEDHGDGYVNWAELEIGQDWTAGWYGVGGVPGTQNLTQDGFAGWTLITIVEDRATYPDPHQVSIYRGWVEPARDEAEAATHVSDFCYPSDEGEQGRLLLTAVEGDARLNGDYLLFGNSTDWEARNVMWGSRNALNNFFASQLVGRDGEYIEGGRNYAPLDHAPWDSFDCWMEDYDSNPDDARSVDCLKDGGRQGWDIANIPINDTWGEECSYVDAAIAVTDVPCNPDIFEAGDTEAWFLPMTTSDEYWVLGVALDLPSYAASVTTMVEPSADSSVYVNPGSGISDTAELVVRLTNAGNVTAKHMKYAHTFPSNVSRLVSLSYQIDSASAVTPSGSTLSTLAAGLSLPDLAAASQLTLRYTIEVDDYAPADPIVTAPVWSYDWTSCTTTTAESVTADEIVIDVDWCTDLDGDGLCADIEEDIDTDDDDADSDDDGLTDDEEYSTTHTDPTLADTDGDGLQDGTELGLRSGDIHADTNTSVFIPDADYTTTTDPLDADTDNGGVRDGVEDSDRDGKIDGGECNPNNPADDGTCTDSDDDGLSDDAEGDIGTDPYDDDTDNDGLLDGNEASMGSNPLQRDTDGDGLQDGTEYGLTAPQGDDTDRSLFIPDGDASTTTSPIEPDSDDDALGDGEEDADHDGRQDAGETDADDDDSDDDGVIDGSELTYGTDPLDNDTDNDGLPDGLELGLTAPQGSDTRPGSFQPDADPLTTTDPTDADTDDGGVPDGEEDSDHDGAYEPGERDPLDPADDLGGSEDDCDGDGWSDAEETLYGTLPCDPDSDDDGIPDPQDGEQDHDGDGDIDALDPDSDDDGFGDSSEDQNGNGIVDEGETDPDAPNKMQGSGGCAVLPVGGALGWAPFAILALVGLRRRRGLLAAGVLAAPVAAAQEGPQIDIQRFDPVAQPTGYARVAEAKLTPGGTWVVGAAANYGLNPFEVGTDTGARQIGLVDHLVGFDLMAGYALGDRLYLGASLPAAQLSFAASEGEALLSDLGSSNATFALGDLTLMPMIGLVSSERGVNLSVIPRMVLPTGSKGSLVGLHTVAMGGDVALGLPLGKANLTVNAGYQYNAESAPVGTVLDDDIARLAVGLAIPAGAGAFVAELVGNTSTSPERFAAVGAGAFDEAHTPLEFTVGFRPGPMGKLRTVVEGGPGLTHGFGTPDARVFGVARLTNYTEVVPMPVVVDDDQDDDGIVDSLDRCPTVPEDLDQFQDEDGCPELDNDGDGILDTNDRCPNDPEDPDGFQDSDGCPEPDNDLDGVLDGADRCPIHPEDRDGVEDEDGCPEDNDRDGIADPVDACPNEAETFNGIEDADGCPDGKQLVVIHDSQIEIIEKIYFETGSDVIMEVSDKLMAAIAEVIVRHPNLKLIEVQGHTDSQGSDAYNLDLSKRRAASVMRNLALRGVESERLSSQGYGETRPVADNADEIGRARNRRVEFHILEQKGDEVRSDTWQP